MPAIPHRSLNPIPMACALALAAPLAQAGTITTVAGTGVEGFGFNNVAPTASDLGYLTRLALGADGSLYIADQSNQRVRKVTAPGTPGAIITVLPAAPGYVEDLAVASDGTLYTASWGGVWRFSGSSSTIYTLTSSSGLALAPDALYFGDSDNGRIGRHSLAGSTLYGSPGLNGPAGLTLADGSLYLAERNAHRVWRIDNPGASLALPASPTVGNGVQGFSGDGGPATEAALDNPSDIALDSAGNLYVTDQANQRVRRVDGLGLIATVAGTGEQSSTGDGGPATLATLAEPNGVVADGDRKLYVAENMGYRVRLITFEPPAAPTGVAATALNDRAIVQWEHDGALATGFTAAAEGDPSLRCDAAAGERSCTIDGLSGNTTYRFKVLARNGDDVSAASAASAPVTAPKSLSDESGVPLGGASTDAAHVTVGGVGVGNDCRVTALEFISPSGAPAAAPMGALHLRAEDCDAGSRLTVRIDYPPGSLAGLYPWKYGPATAGAAATWFRHGQAIGDSVYYEVVNNGMGDGDNDVFIIEDPHAMLPLAALPPGPGGAHAIPTLSAWGVALLSALAALLGLRGQRRRA